MLYEKKADEKRHFLFDKYTTYHPYVPLPHYHSSIEIFILEKGEYWVTVEGERRKLAEGDIAFIDRFTPHTSGSVDGSGELSLYVLVAGSEYFDNVRWLDRQTLATYTERREGFEDILALTSLAHSIRERLDDEARCGFIRMLLGLLHGYADIRDKSRERGNHAVIEIMKYVSASYSEKITLESLSDKFGYEKTYLSKMINRAFGMNLREYLNRVRVSAAKLERQKNPNKAIYKIAEECGFESENTFYRALKRYG
ncbi:MAG: helix-turn-helix domain-containing protein [Clostridia bacterium]|nr:helix-turn-helix domain-containing protein [Clostridia bacterium]